VVSDTYLFERIAADAISDIRSGRLGPGEALPMIKEWKAKYGCGYYSVRQARLLLVRRQYVEKFGQNMCVTSFAPFL
jgi:DNA-binding GntR family transcriptional regulator